MSLKTINDIDEIQATLIHAKKFRGDWLIWQIIGEKRLSFRSYILDAVWGRQKLAFKNCEHTPFNFQEGVPLNFFQREKRLIYVSSFSQMESNKITTKVPESIKLLQFNSKEEKEVQKMEELHQYTQKIFVKNYTREDKASRDKAVIKIAGRVYEVGQTSKKFMESFYGDLENLDDVLEVSILEKIVAQQAKEDERRESIRISPKTPGKKVCVNILDENHIIKKSGFYELVDISRGGVCIKSEYENEFSPKKNVEIFVQGFEPIPGTVVHTHSPENEGGVKVGIAFQQ